MRSVVVIEKPLDVLNELDALGLKVDELKRAVDAAVLAKNQCTPHHPNYYVGIAPQAEAVKTLSDLLVPIGWARRDVKNSPRLVSPHGDVRIAIHTGDEATGNPKLFPRTRSTKGPTAQGDVQSNAEQWSLPMDIPVTLAPRRVLRNASNTWFLLFAINEFEARAELSLPVHMDEDDHVSEWGKRIILGVSRFDRGPSRGIGPVKEMEELDIPVQRKRR